MNKTRKGKKAEVKTKKWLEQQGFVVYKPPSTRFGAKDVFGLFDLIAVKPQHAPPSFLPHTIGFIQVKTNKNHYYTAVKKIRNWVNTHHVHGCWFSVVCLQDKNNTLVWVSHEKKETVHKNKI